MPEVHAVLVDIPGEPGQQRPHPAVIGLQTLVFDRHRDDVPQAVEREAGAAEPGLPAAHAPHDRLEHLHQPIRGQVPGIDDVELAVAHAATCGPHRRGRRGIDDARQGRLQAPSIRRAPPHQLVEQLARGAGGRHRRLGLERLGDREADLLRVLQRGGIQRRRVQAAHQALDLLALGQHGASGSSGLVDGERPGGSETRQVVPHRRGRRHPVAVELEDRAHGRPDAGRREQAEGAGRIGRRHPISRDQPHRHPQRVPGGVAHHAQQARVGHPGVDLGWGRSVGLGDQAGDLGQERAHEGRARRLVGRAVHVAVARRRVPHQRPLADAQRSGYREQRVLEPERLGFPSVQERWGDRQGDVPHVQSGPGFEDPEAARFAVVRGYVGGEGGSVSVRHRDDPAILGPVQLQGRHPVAVPDRRIHRPHRQEAADPLGGHRLQQRGDDVGQRSTDGRGEAVQRLGGSGEVGVQGRRRVLVEVPLRPQEDMERLRHLHQARGAQRVPERRQPAVGVRPAGHGPLRGLERREPEGLQERHLYGRERVVQHREGGRAQVVQVRARLLADPLERLPDRLVESQGLGATSQAQRCVPLADTEHPHDPTRARAQPLPHDPDVGREHHRARPHARRRDVEDTHPGRDPGRALGSIAPGRRALRRVVLTTERQLAQDELVDQRARRVGGDVRRAAVVPAPGGQEAVEQQIADRQHVHSELPLALVDDPGDRAHRVCAAPHRLPGHHQRGPGLLQPPEQVHRR